MPASDSLQLDDRATCSSPPRCPRCGGALESSADQLICPSCRRSWPDDVVFLSSRRDRLSNSYLRLRTFIAIGATLLIMPFIAGVIGVVVPFAIAVVPLMHAAMLLALKIPIDRSMLSAHGRLRPIVVFSRRGAERWRRGVLRIQLQWHHMPFVRIRPVHDGVYFDCSAGLRGTIELPERDRERFMRALSTRWTEPFTPSTVQDSTDAPPWDRDAEACILPDDFRLFRCERCHYPTLHLGTIDTCPECGSALHPASALIRCHQSIERTLYILGCILLFFVTATLAGEGIGWTVPVTFLAFAAFFIGVAMGWKLLEYGRWIIVLQPRTILVGRFKRFREIPFSLLDECIIDNGTRLDDRTTPRWRLIISRADQPWRFIGSFTASTAVVRTLNARMQRWRYEERSRSSTNRPTAEN